MRVTTTWLESRERGDTVVGALPEGHSIVRAAPMTPEYARFLYALVGGPWQWTDRLGWTREQWTDELSSPGTEFWIAYDIGMPVGYVQLRPESTEAGLEVEIRYFGIVESAMGRGLGGRLLELAIDRAWTLEERNPVPPTRRVWVHTCTLDGPAALRNYQARGLTVFRTEETEEDVADRPLGSWAATGGPAAAASD